MTKYTENVSNLSKLDTKVSWQSYSLDRFDERAVKKIPSKIIIFSLEKLEQHTLFQLKPPFFRSKDEYECRESEEILQSSDNSSRPISAMKIRAPLPGSKIDNLRNTIEKQVGIILTKKGFFKIIGFDFPLW